MESFDLIVIGSGSGTHVASMASNAGWRVALIDHGPAGGTCLNNGCIPSKMLIHPADVVRVIQESAAIGVNARIERLDFEEIMERMRSTVKGSRESLERALESTPGLSFYRDRAEFVGDYLLKAGGRTLTAGSIVIATGARPSFPPIRGLEEAGYLDNISLLDLKEPPESLIVIGGGYIGCEYGHFFSAIGTDVTIIGRAGRILSDEDPEVSSIVQMALSRHMRVITGHDVVAVRREDGGKVVSARSSDDGQVHEFEAEEILLAAGRRSNSDLLRPERTGVMTDAHGWILVDEYLETTKRDILAIGDAIGRHMFRHTANHEAEVVSHNLLRAKSRHEWIKADFHAVPHAVFTHPQVAAVGMNESEALALGMKVLVGRARYTDVARGHAMAEDGLVKVLVEEGTGRILGAAAVGSSASELIQQITYLMNTEHQDIQPILHSQVIHPAIDEVVAHAISLLEPSERGARKER
ncbi:MAG: dihydrolipoyl dehydrogenase [Methanothrix sp.]|nr:dihydrolipoyl dehydrogenase [Methanothrix sp.]